jgi:hypothetical protein
MRRSGCDDCDRFCSYGYLNVDIWMSKNWEQYLSYLWVLSRDLSNFLQDGLETLVLSSFDNLLLLSQNSRYLQRKIKPFQVILQVIGCISAQYPLPQFLILSIFKVAKNWDAP